MLFLCTGISCRSQTAEGWARSLKTGAIEAFSAGMKREGMNPLAIRAMAEVGADVSGRSRKRPTDLGVEFEYVVTVCDAARRARARRDQGVHRVRSRVPVRLASLAQEGARWPRSGLRISPCAARPGCVEPSPALRRIALRRNRGGSGAPDSRSGGLVWLSGSRGSPMPLLAVPREVRRVYVPPAN
ncbi:MAG: hypothetical protein ACK4WH_16030, partial [Phycisphaerales bacterium]